MIRDLSMFSATEDLEEALSLVCATALGLDRAGARLRLADAGAHLTSEVGYAALRGLWARLDADAAALPDRAALGRLFADEDLSMRALRLHRGRNVYSAGKLAIWNAVWAPLRASLSPDPAALALARELVAIDTRPGASTALDGARWLADQLEAIGFTVRRIDPGEGNPILRAERPARGMAGRLVLYGHYDAAPTDPAAWSSPPLELRERDGRLCGLGVGDNKIALAVRLAALAHMDRTPEIVWLIQGDEETGSRAAHRIFPELMAGLEATLWLEENGYHDPDGTERVLARVVAGDGDEDLPPDRALWSLIERLGVEDRRFGVGYRVECRSLRKDFFPGGCPFNRNLPRGARYLAIGVNDPASGIHRPDESVPTWTLPLHARQLPVVMQWVHETAQEHA